MNCLPILVCQSGLDLNLVRQTSGLLRSRAEVRHAPRQARVFASHGASAAEHVPPMRGRPSGRTQGQGLLVPDQFLAMAFAQLTYRESLRDIEVNLRAQAKRLYHLGFRCATISRNTLANANATRPWQIYADLAQHLIGVARPLYVNEPLAIELRLFMPSTRPPSTCACRSTPGRHFVRPRPRSSCTRCWTSVALSPPSFISPTARRTRSTCWTIWPSSQALSI